VEVGHHVRGFEGPHHLAEPARVGQDLDHDGRAADPAREGTTYGLLVVDDENAKILRQTALPVTGG